MCLPMSVFVCVPRWICLRAGFVWDRICSLLYCISCAPPPRRNHNALPTPKGTQAKHEKPQSCLGQGNKQALHIDLIDLSCVSCARELSIEETVEWGTRRKEEKLRESKRLAPKQTRTSTPPKLFEIYKKWRRELRRVGLGWSTWQMLSLIGNHKFYGLPSTKLKCWIYF